MGQAYSKFEAVLKGSIHSDQLCPVCGSRFKSDEPRGLFCPKHRKQSPSRFVVRYGGITKRFTSYESALQFLTGLRFQEGSGNFDLRDYQVKARPLSFKRLAEEWLELQLKRIRAGSVRHYRNAIYRAIDFWGDTNIKNLHYSTVEDFLSGLHLAAKTKVDTLSVLKQFFSWAVVRYDVEPLRAWPGLPQPEMRFRKTVSLADQELIIQEIEKITSESRPRAWLAVKWLATYISIRPAEMLSLSEGQVDRGRGLLIIPHPKERRPKLVPLVDEDIKILLDMPLYYDTSAPFFRYTSGPYAGKAFGVQRLYTDWKAACKALRIEGVDLYGGTKHSTAMALRDVATYEEVRKMTGHSTNKAFDRYLRIEGEALKALYSRRQGLLPDNDLITGNARFSLTQVIDFPSK